MCFTFTFKCFCKWFLPQLLLWFFFCSALNWDSAPNLTHFILHQHFLLTQLNTFVRSEITNSSRRRDAAVEWIAVPTSVPGSVVAFMMRNFILIILKGFSPADMLLKMPMWHARWNMSKVFCDLRHVSIRQRAQNNIWKHLEVHSTKKCGWWLDETFNHIQSRPVRICTASWVR